MLNIFRKEVLVSSGILNKEVARVAHNRSKDPQGKKKQNQFVSSILAAQGGAMEDLGLQEQDTSGLDFVYPYGASLNVQDPSHSILGSGPLSYPSGRALSAVCQTGKGKLAVMGSYEIFSDEYFDKEENAKLFDFFLKYFLTDEVEFTFEKDENLL